jgi:DNA transposition AAA+ family ATPase
MTKLHKEKIVEDLKNYVSRFSSQNKAANSLKNVSGATISHMLSGKHDLISEEMWRNVGSQISQASSQEWQSVETRNYVLMTNILKDAQENSLVLAITGEAGTGKSETLRRYASPEHNAFRLQCSEFWNRKLFLSELLTAMGRDYSGLTVGEMMTECIRQLKMRETPLVMLDEADKLTDQVLYFFITLYNALEDHCGIILCATDHLEKRIVRGLKLNKKGYKEIYSRMGRKCIELKSITSTDVHQICMANGITDKHQIQQVWDDCEGDLRRVKRKIHAIKKINERENNQ